MQFPTILSAIIGLSCAVPTFAQQCVKGLTNGDFEDPIFGGWLPYDWSTFVESRDSTGVRSAVYREGPERSSFPKLGPVVAKKSPVDIKGFFNKPSASTREPSNSFWYCANFYGEPGAGYVWCDMVQKTPLCTSATTLYFASAYVELGGPDNCWAGLLLSNGTASNVMLAEDWVELNSTTPSANLSIAVAANPGVLGTAVSIYCEGVAGVAVDNVKISSRRILEA